MKTRLFVRRTRRACAAAALALLAVAAAAHPSAGAQFSADSIYNLDLSLQDQQARSFHLADLRGTVYVASMFYTSCRYACPTMIETINLTLARLPAGAAARALIVSFDTRRDTVRVLGRVAGEHELDRRRWTLARTDAASARKLAAALGIQYRALPDGNFNHSTRLLLLDRDGRIAARTELMGQVDPEFLARLRALDP